jgi:hypothetical protein
LKRKQVVWEEDMIQDTKERLKRNGTGTESGRSVIPKESDRNG